MVQKELWYKSRILVRKLRCSVDPHERSKMGMERENER